MLLSGDLDERFVPKAGSCVRSAELWKRTRQDIIAELAAQLTHQLPELTPPAKAAVRLVAVQSIGMAEHNTLTAVITRVL